MWSRKQSGGSRRGPDIRPVPGSRTASRSAAHRSFSTDISAISLLFPFYFGYSATISYPFWLYSNYFVHISAILPLCRYCFAYYEIISPMGVQTILQVIAPSPLTQSPGDWIRARERSSTQIENGKVMITTKPLGRKAHSLNFAGQLDKKSLLTQNLVINMTLPFSATTRSDAVRLSYIKLRIKPSAA